MARVLVVDDDPALREMFTACLEFDDYEVETASTLARGVALLQHKNFDLILTDLSGAPFSAALVPVQELTKTAAGIPVVFTTAYAEAARLDPEQYGLAAILLQPFELDDLFTCVRRILVTHQARLRSSQATSDEAWAQLQSAREQLEQALPSSIAGEVTERLLTFEDFSILRAMNRAPQRIATTVQVARLAGIRVQQTQRRLALLERAGYVARPTNALIPAFTLTCLGRELAEPA